MRRSALALSAIGVALPQASFGAVVYSGWLSLDVPAEGLTVRLAGQGFDLGEIRLGFGLSTTGSGTQAFFAIRDIGIFGYGSDYAYHFGIEPSIRPSTLRLRGLHPRPSGGADFISDMNPAPEGFNMIWGFQAESGQLGFVRTTNQYENGMAEFTLLDWAFETEPNLPIRSPEPAPTGLAALALGAAAVVRRRRQAKELDAE